MLPSFTKHFTTKQRGPTVVVMGGVHGNERVGVRVIEELERNLSDNLLKGELYLILGNPEAYKLNHRFVETDMNRLFDQENLSVIRKSGSLLNLEQRRVGEVLPILEKAEFLLDLHSTIKPSVPFIFVENTDKHLELATIFETEFIVSVKPNLNCLDLASCTDNFVDSQGGVGLTYESGWHKDNSSFEQVFLKTKKYLNYLGLTTFELQDYSKNPCSPKHLLIEKAIIPQSDSFRYEKDFKNFDKVSKGALIAKEGNTNILAEKDLYLLFVKEDIQKNKPAGFLAVEI
jgi:succinylglutamate desuccinylase